MGARPKTIQIAQPKPKTIYQMKLSILIATVEERQNSFNKLCAEFGRQITEFGKENEVIICSLSDNKQMSIGKKRQKLLETCTADYIVFFDDDDTPRHDYTPQILQALESRPDSVGFKIAMTTNGKNPQLCCHRFAYKKWESNKDGFDYVRTITHFNPVKRELALRAGFKDLRFG